jgi:hypothetical protein
MSHNLDNRIAGIDVDKNAFHVGGLDERGAIVLRQKWSRGQVDARFANMPPCLIGMEACVGAHHLSRKLTVLGHDAQEGSGRAMTGRCRQLLAINRGQWGMLDRERLRPERCPLVSNAT